MGSTTSFNVAPPTEAKARERYICGFNVACAYARIGRQKNRLSLGWKKGTSRVRIECLLSGWIPDLTRCEMTLVLTT
jgi:hypothetical protein